MELKKSDMAAQEVKLLEDLLSFDENDKLLAYSNKYNKSKK